MPAPVDWNRAERTAIRFASRHPMPSTGSIASRDFDDLTPLAEERVAATTGLRSPSGGAHIQVVGRDDWIRANLTSMRTLLDPLLTRWTEASSKRGARSPLRFTGQVAAAEIGMMLGWMSGRVLGQYDLLVTDPAASTGGAVYLVGPNVVSVENKHGFEREQFRLWVALHELTHRAQFTGVPWMREHFVGLTHEVLELADPDPARIFAAVREAARDRVAARQRLRDGGIVAMVSTPEQQAVFDQIAGLMSLLEGHGDVVMDRAGAELIPSAARFARVLRERRRRASPLAKILQRLLGLEGKLNQYAAGERFIAEIERSAGLTAVDNCWQRPENLPSLDEIRQPRLWLRRLGLTDAGLEHSVA